MIKTKFNRWTVLKESGKDKWGSLLVTCRCDCGIVVTIRFNDVRRNRALQCRDCGYRLKRKSIPKLKSPIAGKGNNYRHGMARTKTYKAWFGMKKRCADKVGKNRKYYFDRGITICEHWMSFENFFEDMGEKPQKSYLDRIDNDLGYFNENCRWVNSLVSNRNRRNVKSRMRKRRNIYTGLVNEKEFY